MESMQKKGKSKIGLIIALVVLAGLIAWIVYNGITGGINKIFSFGIKDANISSPYSIVALLFGVFIIIALGYMLGRITIKGVSLGDAGVFLVAILFGFLFTKINPETPILGAFAVQSGDMMNFMYSKVVQNIGLVLFVASVGLIAGPKFFKDLKKNAKSYVLLGATIILIGAVVAILFGLICGKEFSVGILSGALTTTPGYSAAIEAANDLKDPLVTLGHAVAYPFGVIGVVLFVQLMPKLLKADMDKERALLKIGSNNLIERKKGSFKFDEHGLAPFAISVVVGLLLGSIKIPIYDDVTFSLGTTGGVLVSCLIFGHFGRIGKVDFEVSPKVTKMFRELGLILFLVGAGVDGGVSLVSAISSSGQGAMIVVYGLLGGIAMTLIPMIIGFIIATKALKLPLLFALGSITGGMTSTPALGSLIGVSKTEDVATAYASTYPISLVLVVIASNLIIMIM